MAFIRVCPLCGGELFEQRGRNGVFFRCEGFPECSYAERDIVVAQTPKATSFPPPPEQRLSPGRGSSKIPAGLSSPEQKQDGSFFSGGTPPQQTPSMRPKFERKKGSLLSGAKVHSDPKTPSLEISPGTNDELLTPEETCRYLKISRHKLMRMRQDGTGPPFSRFGKHVRYEKKEVSKWVEEKRSP